MIEEASYIDQLQQGIPQARIEARGWRENWAAPVTLFDAPLGFGEELWHVPQTQILIAWHAGGADVVSELSSFRGRSAAAGEHKFNVQRPGMPQHYRAEGRVKFCHFCLTDDIISRVAEGLDLANFSSDSIRDDLVMIPDRELFQLLEIYARRSCDASRPPSRIEMEARALLVVEHLVARYHAGRKPAPMRGGLAAWQIKRTCDAMQAQIDGDIGLDTLAGIAGCSPTHFSRAFKQSMGIAPFHWLAERRVERAKELLEDGKLPLAEIALACGFSGQSQFTTAFGRATGVTPGAWRRGRVP